MNILRKDVDACNAILTLEIGKEDYATAVEKTIKDYAKKANIPGFRVGMVPKGLINKMYGKAILLEEVNKLVSESLFNYIEENKLNILCEPMSNETEQKQINFETDENFEFKFDIALAPEINAAFDKKDKVPFYSIKITDEMVESKVKMHRLQFGTYVKQEVAEADDLFKGDLLEIKQEGEPLEVLDAMLTPKYMKDEVQKSLFLGKKAGDTVIFNPLTAFENKYEISSLLNVDKDKIQNFNHDFEYKIKEITRNQYGELNQELFDKVLGKDAVTDEKSFRKKLSEIMANQYLPDCDYKFMLDVKTLALQKNENIEFPEKFLKRWLKNSQKDMTDEKLAKDFPAILDYLKWDLILKSVAKANSVEISDEQVLETAKADAAIRFAQYGMTNVPSDVLDNYANEMLNKEKAKEDFYRRTYENAVLAIIKGQITLSKKTVTEEEFHKLFE
ncbi:MAG: trigger factor [Prevotellaceae bacterium]|jgi:trigger factor|nr:trigger factor [Prevotellaceae bacterium]